MATHSSGTLSTGGGGSDRPTKHSRELPHVQGQGQWFRVPEAMVQEWLRGATLRLRPGAMAWRRYPMPENRGGGREEPSHV